MLLLALMEMLELADRNLLLDLLYLVQAVVVAVHIIHYLQQLVNLEDQVAVLLTEEFLAVPQVQTQIQPDLVILVDKVVTLAMILKMAEEGEDLADLVVMEQVVEELDLVVSVDSCHQYSRIQNLV